MSEQYSEKELLMLASLVYLPGSTMLAGKSSGTISEIIDRCRDDNGELTEKSVAIMGTGGGLSTKDVCVLLTEMDEEVKKNPSFGELSAARTLNYYGPNGQCDKDVDGLLKAICYTDSRDDNPVVVFRGTGGSIEAWTDNFQGGYETDTKMQSIAADFVNTECSKYQNITVTGHSKGGNLSQYVTVTCADKVQKCVSFDGQGFNKEFIENNKNAVDIAAPKIKSVSAYNDFVNILLTPIAQTVVYAKNEGKGINAHSPLTMLMSNSYDERGNIATSKNQSLISAGLKKATDRIVDCIDTKDLIDKRILSLLTGRAIAEAMVIDDFEDVKKTTAGVTGSTLALLSKKFVEFDRLMIGDRSIEITAVYFDYQRCLAISDEFLSTRSRLQKIRGSIENVLDNLAYNVTAKIYAEKRLLQICENIMKLENNYSCLSQNLFMIAERYKEREQTQSSMI